MRTVIELISHVLDTESAAGKYIGLFLLSLAVLYVYRKKEMLGYGLISFLLAIFPVTAYLFVPAFRISNGYWELLWTVPFLLVTAYAGALLTGGFSGRKRMLAVAGCLALIACSGTLLPYKGAAVKIKYADENVQTAVLAVTAQKEKLQEEVTLLAPKEIMESARSYDADLCLLYGKDMWNTEVNTGIADVYSPDLQALYERMETDYLYPGEIAEQAEWYGCNVLVLREKIPEESKAYDRWELADSPPGYLVYRIRNQ